MRIPDAFQVLLGVTVPQTLMSETFLTHAMFLAFLVERVVDFCPRVFRLVETELQLLQVFMGLVEGDSILLRGEARVMQGGLELGDPVLEAVDLLLIDLFSVVEFFKEVPVGSSHAVTADVRLGSESVGGWPGSMV